MKPLYTNGAVGKITASISATDLAITVSGSNRFPNPITGSESFWMTLVGNVSQAVEVVEVTGRQGDAMSIIRGQQNTVPQAFGVDDQAYHALTAEDAINFRDAMEFYLGANTADPMTGNYGEPLKAGMLYFNTSLSSMREYDGTTWRGFGAIINITAGTEFLWDAHAGLDVDGTLVYPDDVGNATGPDIISTDLISVFVDGVKLQESEDPDITLGFKVTVGSPGIVIIDSGVVTSGSPKITMTKATVADDSATHISRDETSVVGYQFVKNDPLIAAPEDTKLITEDAIKTYVDAQVAIAIAAHDDRFADIRTGFKNILINPLEQINQRSVTDPWGSLANGDFRADRWSKFNTFKQQIIDTVNLFNQKYTLSWVGGGVGEIWASVDGSNAALTLVGAGESLSAAMTFDYVGATHGYIVIRVPQDLAGQMQFERGPNATGFDLLSRELMRTQVENYYEKSFGQGAGTLFNANVTSGSSYVSLGRFNTIKRINNPIVVLSNSASPQHFDNVSGTALNISADGFTEERIATATGNNGRFQSSWTADAEIVLT